ncbi:MAG: alanine--tRNA ligase [Roseibacillus sp.]
MTAAEIRQSFLDFFVEKGHTIVPSASLLPQSPGLLFTNAGMNQFVPYFLGTDKAPYNPARATDTQKCIRAGGKHNDLDDVGQDSYHHTFFEMLGNWSFGDYFKEEAINWAWELVVERWGFPPERLYATVYRPGEGDPSEFDQEAYDHWKVLFKKAGCDPDVQIVDGNKADNFWMMGATGPCGPCSELHVDLTPEGGTKGALVNKESDQCIEIWNLVFIQFNAEADGTFRDLPSRHVDTGLGFERACSIIQNTKGFTDFSRKPSNYNTDVFRPLFDTLEELSGKKYVDVYPGPGQELSEEVKDAVAFRVLGDHIRTLSFAIADGILPDKKKRGAVVRQILRRAVRYGRQLGFSEKTHVLSKLVDTVVDAMKATFPELEANADKIKAVLAEEESSFNETLDRGLALFEKEVGSLSEAIFPGQSAFTLEATYGFPKELTALLCREQHLEFDEDGYREARDEHERISRGDKTADVLRALEIATEVVTNFVGFGQDECEATVLEEHAGDEVKWIITDQTPLYAEMGGQVGDTGTLVVEGREIPVVAVQQIGGARAHGVPEDQAGELKPGDKVTLRLDPERRRPIEAHHSATHLLHWALHEVVSADATQQGSLVAVDRLRFDFTSGAVSAEQIAEIEEKVNACIQAGQPVSWKEVPYPEVQGRDDIIQFFGDKYGAEVRVVQIGGEAQALNGYSMELCGGTHVRNTREIGLFKIKKEEGIAAGTRRIEAVCGKAAWEALQEEGLAIFEETQAAERKLAAANANLEAAGADPIRVAELPHYVVEAVVARGDITEINTLLATIRKHRDELRSAAVNAEKKVKKAQTANAARQADEFLASVIEDGASTANLVHAFDGPAALLQELLNGLKKVQFTHAAFLVVDDGEKLHLGALCGEDGHNAGLGAGNLIVDLAPIVGGKGGGKPDMARGAGADRDKKDELLEAARKLL